jgi:hypothetical protein
VVSFLGCRRFVESSAVSLDDSALSL